MDELGFGAPSISEEGSTFVKKTTTRLRMARAITESVFKQLRRFLRRGQHFLRKQLLDFEWPEP